jgi:hypothetical protein
MLRAMNRFRCGFGVIVLFAGWPMLSGAQEPGSREMREAEINLLKMEITRAEALEKRFAEELKHCNVLDGKNFYLENQHRVLSLEQFHQTLQNLVKEKALNARKNGPWTEEDAAERLKVVGKIAQQDKERCEAVAKLPATRKRLDELLAPGR